MFLFLLEGPLKEFKKSDLPKNIWDNSYKSCKNAVNYLHDIDIKPDFLVTNFVVSASRINIDKIHPKTINIGLDVGGMKQLREKMNYMVKILWKVNAINW